VSGQPSRVDCPWDSTHVGDLDLTVDTLFYSQALTKDTRSALFSVYAEWPVIMSTMRMKHVTTVTYLRALIVMGLVMAAVITINFIKLPAMKNDPIEVRSNFPLLF
jgi:hypothetical protein